MTDQGPQLDWAAAEVADRTLTVHVAGERPDGWDDAFGVTLVLLASDAHWGRPSYDDGTVTVADVDPDLTDELRFALDGAVQEASARHAVPRDDDGTDGDGDDDERPRNDVDRQIAERLRDAAD